MNRMKVSVEHDARRLSGSRPVPVREQTGSDPDGSETTYPVDPSVPADGRRSTRSFFPRSALLRPRSEELFADPHVGIGPARLRSEDTSRSDDYRFSGASSAGRSRHFTPRASPEGARYGSSPDFSTLKTLSADSNSGEYGYWFVFRLLTTIVESVLLACVLDEFHARPQDPSRPAWSSVRVVGDTLCAIDFTFISVKAYYLWTRRVRDHWMYAEIALTWFCAFFQLAYWPAYLLFGPQLAIRLLAFASFRVFRVCIYLRRMREILSGLVMSYKEFAISFLLLLIATNVFTTLFLCLFEPSAESSFKGFTDSYITTAQILTLHDVTGIYLRSRSRHPFVSALELIAILSWVFLGAFLLANVITAVMVASFLRRRAEYDKSVTEKRRMERSRRGRRRLAGVFPFFYAQSVEWANREPYFSTIGELASDVARLMEAVEVWKRPWLAAIPFLADEPAETVWPTQVLIYYETILGILDSLIAEVKFLLNLTQEVAMLAISNRLEKRERIRELMDARNGGYANDRGGDHSDTDEDASPPSSADFDWENVEFG